MGRTGLTAGGLAATLLVQTVIVAPLQASNEFRVLACCASRCHHPVALSEASRCDCCVISPHTAAPTIVSAAKANHVDHGAPFVIILPFSASGVTSDASRAAIERGPPHRTGPIFLLTRVFRC